VNLELASRERREAAPISSEPRIVSFSPSVSLCPWPLREFCLSAIAPIRRTALPATNVGDSTVGPLCLLAAGFLLRLFLASRTFLNPDEALHYLLSVQPSLAAAYRASLTTDHPPLLILLLHCWSVFGHSELVLRLPSVFAGTAFCWIMFGWLQRVASQAAALIGQALFLFSPPLISLSAEIRQYALLLFFAAASLYLLERAIQEQSIRLVLFSSAAICLALLSHYSALILAFTIGIYGLLRFRPRGSSATLISGWMVGQLCALGVVAFLYVSHLRKLVATREPQRLANTFLKGSTFHPGQERVAVFVGRATLRLFHYLFSQGAVGALGLLLFLAGIALLVRASPLDSAPEKPRLRSLGLWLLLPFALCCGAGVAGVYPYGGTRHDAFLAMFAMPAIATTLGRWEISPKWIKPSVIAAVLAFCVLLPTPSGESIRLKNQNLTRMAEAVAHLRSLPPQSIILTDDQGGLLLSYYLCHRRVVQIEEQTFRPLFRSRCNDDWVISLDPDVWAFSADNFPATLRAAARGYGLSPGTPLWVVQAGWSVDKDQELHNTFRRFGCSAPKEFGRNIFVCQIASPGPGGDATPDLGTP
jgi:4-amino-4-deoxy-L-arabinose transferase-like glycosyltransferase